MAMRTLLIKPASGLCNLGCTYCFYHDVTENRQVQSYGFMNNATMEKLIDRSFEDHPTAIHFAFQGGEPTLIGLDFYQRFVAYVKNKASTIPVTYSIQTNGFNIDDAFAVFLHDHAFLVGISLDGIKAIHDRYRKDQQGKGTHQRVLQTIHLFNKHQVEYNILTVITKDVARHIQKIYAYYRQQGFLYLQFIPCLDDLSEEQRSSLSAEDYLYFLNTLLRLWHEDLKKGHYVSIRYFDNLFQMLFGYPPESCDMMGRCSANLVLESNGNVYPCDFYVLDSWLLGNIFDADFKTLQTTDTAKAFVESSLELSEDCKVCPYVNLCRGGCRRHRLELSEGHLGHNHFCKAYYGFFTENKERLEAIYRLLQRRQQGNSL